MVGITQDGHYVSLLDETLPYLFLPLWQNPAPAAIVHVRAAEDATAMIPLIRSAARDLHSNVPIFEAALLGSLTSVGLLPYRLAASALSVFGAVAWDWRRSASTAFWGTQSAFAAGRLESGWLLALSRAPSWGYFSSGGCGSSPSASASGLIVAAIVTRLLSSWLFQVSPTDPLTFASTVALLLAVAVLASYLPARRAARLDPVQVLRSE